MKHPAALAYTIDMAIFVYISMCILAAWLYLAAWFMRNTRDTAGYIKGFLVIALLIYFPSRISPDTEITKYWNLAQLGIVWLLFAVAFLFWPRLKNVLSRFRVPALTRGSQSGRVSGRELDLVLGTAKPWLLVAGQVFPLIIATRFTFGMPHVWLFFLTIFGTVVGAISGQAAARSRALWLRGGWSRAELFDAVERSFLRHNAIVLGALLVPIAVVGSYAGFPPRLLAAGLPLLVLGSALSTYLGLMTTRGVRWLEMVLAVVVVLSLMFLALMTEAPDKLAALVIAQLALAALGWWLRTVARRRWAGIDWSLCRSERLALIRMG